MIRSSLQSTWDFIVWVGKKISRFISGDGYEEGLPRSSPYVKYTCLSVIPNLISRFVLMFFYSYYHSTVNFLRDTRESYECDLLTMSGLF